MPKRTDIKSIMIIGAGPIVIGQACEFDYSGTQACKALREEGYRVILVNSNPATIMTDPDLADATYIEPITPEVVARIIEKYGQFTLVTSFEVMEHVPDPVAFFRDAARLVAPGGHLVISVPHGQGLYRWWTLEPCQWPPHHITHWRTCICVAQRHAQYSWRPHAWSPCKSSCIRNV